MVKKNYDHHPNYYFYEGDTKDVSLLKKLIKDCDQGIGFEAKTNFVVAIDEIIPRVAEQIRQGDIKNGC